MTVLTLSSFAPMMPEILLLVSALTLLMVGVFAKGKGFETITWLAVLTVALSAARLVDQFDGATFRLFDGLFISNSFIAGLKVIILVALGFGLLLSLIPKQDKVMTRFEYPVLVMLTGLGMMLMVSAGNFMTFYLGLEMQSLALYILVSFASHEAKSSEAGLKYFVLGALSSGFMLFGLSMIYGAVGSLDYQSVFLALEKLAASGPIMHMGLTVGLVLLLVGLAFKLSAVPFHMWTPDVYEGSPLPVTALISLAPFKIAALGVLVMVLFLPFGFMVKDWQQIIVLISAASMVLGAVAALRQNNIKRLLGYSSIAHMGYMLLAVALNNGNGIRALLFYVVIYVLMNAGAFAALLTLSSKGKSIETIDDLMGLGKQYPLVGLTLAAMMFSMAGIPPLAGFWGKFYIFTAAIKSGFLWLAIVGVLSSLVAAYYYLRVVKVIYFDEPRAGLSYHTSRLARAVMIGIFALNIVLFINPNVVTYLASTMIGGLF